LPELAGRLLDAYQADDYKKHFDFIDYLRPEKNPARLRELDDALIAALATREITDAHLAAPETLDWLDVYGFRFSSMTNEEESEPDPRITVYLNSRDEDDFDLALLKSDRLVAIRASDRQVMATWPVYRCIVYQTEVDGCMFVLSVGQWFRVDLEYNDKLDAEIKAIQELSGLPDADLGTDEGAYNIKAANEMNALCLDKKLVYDGGPDKMEICDILTREGGLIHVKQRGSSSTLSHLFAQGVNSAERLLLDQDFRSKARAVVIDEDPSYADVLPDERPLASDHEISFVVITRSKRGTPLTLPFFSLISLRNAVSRLRSSAFASRLPQFMSRLTDDVSIGNPPSSRHGLARAVRTLWSGWRFRPFPLKHDRCVRIQRDDPSNVLTAGERLPKCDAITNRIRGIGSRASSRPVCAEF
jgi:uncharacterized protein (TIGR04141 family)